MDGLVEEFLLCVVQEFWNGSLRKTNSSIISSLKGSYKDHLPEQMLEDHRRYQGNS
jgi:hypothetical protein